MNPDSTPASVRSSSFRRGPVWLILLACFIVTRCLFVTARTEITSDLLIYYEAYEAACGPGGLRAVLTGGEFPYPPLASVIVLFPGKAAGLFTPVTPRVYFAAYRLWMIAFDLGIFLLLPALLYISNRRISSREGVIRMMLYVGGVSLLAPLAYERLDLVVAFLIGLAVWLTWTDRVCSGAFCLGLGVAVKLTPLLLVPPLLIFVWNLRLDRRLRRLVTVLLSGIGGIAAGLVPFLILYGSNSLSFITYQAKRGVQVESMLSSGALIGHLLGMSAEVVREARAFSLRFPHWRFIVTLWTILGIGALIALTVLCWLRREQLTDSVAGRARTALWLTLFMSAGIVVSKVFSPQFLIWLFPLVPLLPVEGARSRQPLIIWGMLLFLTAAISFQCNRALPALRPVAIGLLALRNALFATFTLLLLHRSRRPTPSPSPPPAHPSKPPDKE